MNVFRFQKLFRFLEFELRQMFNCHVYPGGGEVTLAAESHIRSRRYHVVSAYMRHVPKSKDSREKTAHAKDTPVQYRLQPIPTLSLRACTRQLWGYIKQVHSGWAFAQDKWNRENMNVTMVSSISDVPMRECTLVCKHQRLCVLCMGTRKKRLHKLSMHLFQFVTAIKHTFADVEVEAFVGQQQFAGCNRNM